MNHACQRTIEVDQIFLFSFLSPLRLRKTLPIPPFVNSHAKLNIKVQSETKSLATNELGNHVYLVAIWKKLISFFSNKCLYEGFECC